MTTKNTSSSWGSHAVLENSARHTGALAFAARFGMTEEHKALYTPLFLALVDSSAGELATSFGLFEKDGMLWEVSGTQCSVWGLKGQFEPEPTTIAELKHRIDQGLLGQIDGGGRDIYASTLRSLLDEPDIVAIDQRAQSDVGKVRNGFLLDAEVFTPPVAASARLGSCRLNHLQESLFPNVFASRLVALESPAHRKEGSVQFRHGGLYRFDRGETTLYAAIQHGGLVRFIGSKNETVTFSSEVQEMRQMALELWEVMRISMDLGVDMAGDTAIDDVGQPGPGF